MIRTTIDFHNRVDRGETPTPYVSIVTPLGVRLYGERAISDALEYGGALLDGSFTLDGSVILGESEISLSKTPAVISFGKLTKQVSPIDNDLLTGYTSKRGQRYQVVLNNGDRSITQLMGKEPLIGQTLQVRIGFEDDNYLTHLTLFSGIVNMVTVDLDTVRLEALESE